MHSESETNTLKCLGSWKILLTFSDSPIRQFSCLKKHKKCGLVMIKLAHKAPQECGNRNVVMALHDIELKHFFCQYWSEKLEWQLWIYSGSWTRGLPLISFLLSHTVSLSYCLSLSLVLAMFWDTLCYNVTESKAHRAFAIYGCNGNCQCYNRLYQLV